MKRSIILILILTAVFEPFSSIKAEEDGASALAGLGLLVSGLTIIFSGIGDIASAAESAEKYNATLTEMSLLASVHEVNAVPRMFAQPAFSRAALLKNGDRRVFYTLQVSQRHKNPGTATLWSLGSTLIPTASGYLMMEAGGWNSNSPSFIAGVVTVSGGWVFGPSAGHWYAKQNARGWTSALIRMAAYGVGFFCLSAVASEG